MSGILVDSNGRYTMPANLKSEPDNVYHQIG